MTVLDTKVLSEMIKPSPEPAVVQWFGAQPGDRRDTTSITQAEILFGIELLPARRRRRELREGIDRLFDEVFRSRIISPWDRRPPLRTRR